MLLARSHHFDSAEPLSVTELSTVELEVDAYCAFLKARQLSAGEVLP